MWRLNAYTKDTIASLIQIRAGETKLGEALHFVQDGEGLPLALKHCGARFVLLGVPEDVGVRANLGIGGTGTAWPYFLKSFLNLQETPLLSGEQVLLLGHLEPSSGHLPGDIGTEALRKATQELDESLAPLIRSIVSCGKIPLVVGGGHNNAYPLLRGASEALGRAVHCTNMDAHSDFRPLEGRHSGNGFRYAMHEGWMRKYAIVGLHEGYNSATIVQELLSNENIQASFWEDIFLRNLFSWEEAIDRALNFIGDGPYGVELDVDSICHVLSSAATPVGVHSTEAMRYLYKAAQKGAPLYLHLPEGIVTRADGEHDPATGKLLSYLVQAFCKGILENRMRDTA